MTLLRNTALLAGTFGLLAAPAGAESVKEFYTGKQMTIVVGNAEGGTYDYYGRLGAMIMEKFLPGNPKVVMQYMPGAGGTKAANYMAQIAPKDGSVLSSMHASAVQAQLLRPTGIRYDSSKFLYIGQFTPLTSALGVWHTAPATDVAGAKEKQVVMGATGKGSYQYQLPALMNELLGTKFKLIPGYKGIRSQNLAIERGEIHGRGGTIVSWVVSRPDWIKEGKIKFLVQVGSKRDKAFPDVPLATELTDNPDEKKMFQLLSSGSILGRLLIGTPDTPADRAAALRAAFDKGVKDPEVQADAKKRKLTLDPATGPELAALVDDIVATPKPTVDKVVKLLGLKR